MPVAASTGEVKADLVEDGGAKDDLSAAAAAAAAEAAVGLRFRDVDDEGVAVDGVGIAASALEASGLGGAVSSPSRALSGWSAPPLAFFCLPSRFAIRRDALPARRPLRRRPSPRAAAIARKLIAFLLR